MRKALYILGVLDDSDVEWIGSHGERQFLAAGQVLIREGQPIQHLYFLLEGQLLVSVGARDSAPGTEIARLLPGEIVGEISYVDSRPPSASVSALADSLLWAVSRERLTRKLGRDVGFAARFYRAIALFLADRLYVTVGRFGYGSHRQDSDVDELQEEMMEDVSMGAIRFDRLLRHLRGDTGAMSVAATRQ
jgi:CRP/FNR family transcriptional regulator, cyclic AMP receptor protein